MPSGPHRNSRSAAATIDFAARQQLIIGCCRAQNRPMRDREIFQILNLYEKNSASPCVTQLINAGVLFEFDDVICPDTGKIVRRVALNLPPWLPVHILTISAKINGRFDIDKLLYIAKELGVALKEEAPEARVTVTSRLQDGRFSSKDEEFDSSKEKT